MASEIELDEEYNLSEGSVGDDYDPNISVEDTVLETTSDDAYNLNISVAVVETESDEVDSEFIEALAEIRGQNSFPCPKCKKVCKSKGGLTKHNNSKHRLEDQMMIAVLQLNKKRVFRKTMWLLLSKRLRPS